MVRFKVKLKKKKTGVDKFRRLRKVMVHRPEDAIKLIDSENSGHFLFDYPPDADKYLLEHEQYSRLLTNLGVEVLELSDYVCRNSDLLQRLPNLAYMHDTAVASKHGIVLSKMTPGGRQHEELVVKEALQNLGLPLLYEFEEGDQFESFQILSPGTLFVACTQRHSKGSINKFIKFILNYYDEVILTEVPQERRFMHADMVCSRVSEKLVLTYLPAFLHTWCISQNCSREINFKSFLKGRKIDVFSVTDEEQKKWGCSFVALEPGVIINYDISLDMRTINALEREGTRFIHFHPHALLAGGGSLRCLTLKLLRE